MTEKRKNERPYERFVREYMEGYIAGESIKQIAARLDTTENTVSVYAAGLRRNGVELPRISDRFDAGYLNRIIHAKKKRAKKWVA